MARIIAVANQKGGTGKTTTAVNLGTFFAALGKRVLLVDVDPQGNATSAFGIKPENLAVSIYHALIGKVPAKDVLRGTGILSFDILPASLDLAGANVELLAMPQREFQLKNALEELVREYDIVLIDCPPSLGILTINAMAAASEVLIPVQSEYFALQGIKQLLDTIELIKRNLGVELVISGAFLTMFDRRLKLSRDVAQEVRKTFPGRVFEVEIPRNIDLAEAPIAGKSILQHAPDSEGANAYRRLAQELLENI